MSDGDGMYEINMCGDMIIRRHCQIFYRHGNVCIEVLYKNDENHKFIKKIKYCIRHEKVYWSTKKITNLLKKIKSQGYIQNRKSLFL